MKKVIFIVCVFLTLCGCNVMDMNNTPKKQVEKFFNSYQILDKKVLEDLDKKVSTKTELDEKQKEKYRDILKKHYEKLDYEIKDETINGNNATVKVEIEVNDYSQILKNVEEHKTQYPDEFYGSNNEYNDSIFQEYKLNAIKDSNERIKYTLYITLTKTDGKWTLDTISDVDEEKILGIYEY